MSAIAGMLLVLGGGCATVKPGAPGAQDVSMQGGRQQTVLLLRVVTEVDGESSPAFRSTAPDDDIWLGLANFSSGLNLKPAELQFLSDGTRTEGWTYLLVQPGVQYIGAHEPRSRNVFAHNARWTTCPRWSVDIPAGARLVYGGSLFLPGNGRVIFFGPRMLVSFDEERLEVRDESETAETIARQWFSDLLPMSIQLLKRQVPGETLIIDTPSAK